MKWNIKKNITASLLAALAIMIGIAWVCYRSTQGLIINNRWVEHTYEVIDKLDDLQQDLTTAESGQRIFIFTGDEQSLHPYQEVQPHFSNHLEGLKHLTQDNPHQQQRIETLRPLIDERIELHNRRIAVRRERGIEAAQAVRTDRERELTDGINQTLDAMKKEETELLAQRMERAEASAKSAVLMLFLGILVSVGLLLITFYVLNRQMCVRVQSEESLRQSEERFQLVARATKDTLWDLNLRTNEVWWNDNFALMLGVCVDELERRIEMWTSRIHPDDAERVERDIVRAIESGEQTWSGEYRLRRCDGSYAVVFSRAYIAYDDSGQPVRMVGSMADVTEQKQIVEELRKREAQLAESQRIAHLGSWEWDIAANKIYWSDENFRLFGLEPKEIVPTFEAYTSFVHPEDREPVLNAIETVLKDKTDAPLDYRIVHRDGAIRSVHSNATLILNANGEPTHLFGTMQDVTESRKAEAALAESEERFRLLVEDVRDYAILMLDANGYIVSWNHGAEKIKGYKAEEIIGRHFRNFYLPEDQQRKHPEHELEIAAAEGHYEEEGWRVRKDGTTFWALVVITALYDEDGRLRGFSKVTRDITERKRMEEELKQARDVAVESARLKSEFLANMSHEIRTPMNGVIGMTGLLLDTELTVEQREFAETIRASSEALLTIINDILDFSKIEAGKLQFEMLDFDLTNVVEGTVELLAERAQEKKMELASLIYSDVPTELRGDPGRLRQVLTNLVGNAVKFTEHGEVIVSAKKESETDNEVVIRFAVRDTGIGIGEAAQRNLFQAFTQADGSTTRKYGGTGLGLAISKQLVERMGGQIGVNSEPGKGSTFWFTARFEKQPFKIVTQPSVASLDNLRVLIVDDNATNRKILSHQLSSWGMIHDEADSGVLALELLRSAAALGTAYDLAILDLMMPGMDGFELARAIKADAQIAGMHLILLTSFGHRGHGAMAREAGVAAYLTKPVRQSQLFDCLTNVVSQSTLTARTDKPSPRSASKVLTRHTLNEAKKTVLNKLILLAEDNMVNQKVAVRQLQKLGYRADTVADGKEAVEALTRIPYDLVLMDCQMPEMDGYEATAEIRRREGKTKHTPIVAMTANALEGDRERCLAAGMDDYVSKPVKPEELGAVLGRWLSADSKSAEVASPVTEEVALPVDMERLYLAMGDEPEELSDILSVYLNQMSESLEKLEGAIESGDSEEVNLIAHNCAGVSANCGMTALIGPLRKLERMGHEHQLAGAAATGAQLRKEFERVRLFLEENLEQVGV